MSQKFRKGSARAPQQVRKKSRPAVRKPAKVDNSRTPVTRVGDGRDHHDTISTQVWYLLVDQPKEPEDSVALDQGSHHWPMMFTTNADPLYDTLLVFVLTFEHVADTGKCTLELTRGESSVELFTKIETKDLFIYDFGSCPESQSGEDSQANQRALDYRKIPPHPASDDPDLAWPEGPYASITEGGS
jgi:hypothetical protein